MSMQFEWDSAKALSNLRKHGVSFDEAQTVFRDALLLTFSDRYHSVSEHRLISVGSSAAGNVLVVIHTERHGRIRIISCRKATAHERRSYEEA
jgi:uncharacterized DUF497 family protein